MRQRVERAPDLGMEAIKQRLGLDCTNGAIHWVLSVAIANYLHDPRHRPSDFLRHAARQFIGGE
jgi:hypothetical protein